MFQAFFSVLESLHELEDNDLDALMADLMADLDATELKLAAETDQLKVPSPPRPDLPLKRVAPPSASSITSPSSPEDGSSASSVSTPASSAACLFPAPPPQSAKPAMVSNFSNYLNRRQF